MPKGFRCSSCGEWHDELPLDFGFGEPDYIAELDAESRKHLAKGVGDFRELVRDGGSHYFIRGVIEIPITGSSGWFRYGVWASLSEQSYEAAKNAYRTKSDAGPFFGWSAIGSRTIPRRSSSKRTFTFARQRGPRSSWNQPTILSLLNSARASRWSACSRLSRGSCIHPRKGG
jgi:hypothetical protein